MKQLILLRHGEAEFSKGLDFDRQLTTSGEERLNRLGETIKNQFEKIDLMYCSPSVRTTATASVMERYLLIKDTNYPEVIYTGDLGKMVELLENIPKSIETCIIIGHNPVISHLLSHLTHENYIGLTPGMLAKIALEIEDWKMIGIASGTLIEIVQ
jgi:phosphohistidine phosphatase